MFQRLLVANRGEIACRIFRTCAQLGIETVAVYSEADRKAQHVLQADRSVCIGPPESKESYLNIERICEVVREHGVDSVHPGYGFLAENAEFADALAKLNVTFVGPSPEVIRLMGDKIESKRLAQEAGVPLAPTLTCEPDPKSGDYDLAAIQNFAEETGYPLLIKAAAGGGGRGMRRVDSTSELEEALRSASRESQAFFGDNRVFVERYIESARHIEVQVIGDQHGSVRHLFDRDCTMQRYHQKVIEEAPAPALSSKVRDQIHSAAISLCKSANYSNAGTVEFLLERSGAFYFLEVNSRLQVEHPITEKILGVDIVELQLRTACGEQLDPLLPSADDLKPKGHAIECRVCAEAPEDNFLASTGKLLGLEFCKAAESVATLRVDTGFIAGDRVSHHYDSLMAKVIVHAPTREEAVLEMRSVLSRAVVAGLKSNVGFLIDLLDSDSFNEITHDTKVAVSLMADEREQLRRASLAASLSLFHSIFDGEKTLPPSWQSPLAWRIDGAREITKSARVGDRTIELSIEPHGRVGFLVRADVEEERFEYRIDEITGSDDALSYRLRDQFGLSTVLSATRGQQWVQTPWGWYLVSEPRVGLKRSNDGSATGSGEIASPLPGKIIEIKVSQGATVEEGETLIVIESMKMEHPLKAPCSGEVAEILVNVGDTVEADSTLVSLQ